MPSYITDVEAYNPLGRWVVGEANGLPIAEIARQGGVEGSRLHRWLRRDLLRLPPHEILVAIADGLHRPLLEVVSIAKEATGEVGPLMAETPRQRRILAALAGIKDPEWEQAVLDVVLRLTDQIEHSTRKHSKH